MKHLLAFFVFSASIVAAAEVPFPLSCSNFYQCELPGATSCAETVLNLSMIAFTENSIQGSIEEFQYSGVPSKLLPKGSVIFGEVQELAGKTQIDLNNGKGTSLFTLELNTVFYSDMFKNSAVPMSKDLGETKLTINITGDQVTLKCRVDDMTGN